jgi:aspartokinase-like uncharacterized kinase
MQTVVKLGGSLAKNAQLKKCLIAVEHCFQTKVVIVPGGGEFADTVRKAQQQWGFDDHTAHQMAILAMQQMALLIKSLQPEWSIVKKIEQLTDRTEKVLIWWPQLHELDHAGIPASWQVTSDSLAAWLASSINADELLLLKSTPIQPDDNLAALQRKGIVDALFQNFLTPACQLNIVYYQDFLARLA